MAYNESEWSDWHTFSATAYLYNKSGGNWEQIVRRIVMIALIVLSMLFISSMFICPQASDSRVNIVVKSSAKHQFLRLNASSAGAHASHTANTVVLVFLRLSLRFASSLFCSFVSLSFYFQQARWSWILLYLPFPTGQKRRHTSLSCNWRAQ